MSLLPAIVALLVVMWFATSSGRVVQDAGLSVAERTDRELARQQAEFALRRAAEALVNDEALSGEVSVDEVPVSEHAELGDLPLTLQRLTATGQSHQSRIRLQADYAIDGCESEHDDPCQPRVRRIAWRELPP